MTCYLVHAYQETMDSWVTVDAPTMEDAVEAFANKLYTKRTLPLGQFRIYVAESYPANLHKNGLPKCVHGFILQRESSTKTNESEPVCDKA